MGYGGGGSGGGGSGGSGQVVVAEVIPQSVVEVPSVILLHKNYHHSIKHPQDQSDLILTPRN